LVKDQRTRRQKQIEKQQQVSEFLIGMRVLIAGCGYVGAAFGKTLAKRGHEVFGLTRTGHRTADLEKAGIHSLVADITDANQLANLDSKYDWVISAVTSSGGDAEAYRALYLQGTRNLLRWMQANPQQKFVYISSTSVYGQNDGSIVDETSPTEPDSETSKILIETENLINGAVKETNLPAVILRAAGIYGPGRGYWFKQFLRGEAVIEGDGNRWLNMVHRDDLAGIAISALEKGRPGEIYNAVDDEPVRQLDFFQWLAHALHRPLPPIAPTARPSRKRGSTNKRVSNLKLKTELGYQFIYPTFREGYGSEIEKAGASG
jgi:nucleoside-diphosphate-sugar epimerase